MQTMCLKPEHVTKINHILYKYIWNRRYLALKAPERIKQTIVNTPINKGGFGMLDIVELDESLKLKALGRLLNSNHPFLTLIKNSLDFRNFFMPKLGAKVDTV